MLFNQIVVSNLNVVKCTITTATLPVHQQDICLFGQMNALVSHKLPVYSGHKQSSENVFHFYSNLFIYQNSLI